MQNAFSPTILKTLDVRKNVFNACSKNDFLRKKESSDVLTLNPSSVFNTVNTLFSRKSTVGYANTCDFAF
jgi:hypothetical protein